MGYTHYFSFDGDAEVFGKVALDAKLIIEDQRKVLAGPMGTGDPILGEDVISFNGREDEDGDYETFTIRGESFSDFCKTSRVRPYDAAVTAVLIRLAQHGKGHAEVSSDGTWDEWAEGRAIVKRLFGTAPRKSEVFRR